MIRALGRTTACFVGLFVAGASASTIASPDPTGLASMLSLGVALPVVGYLSVQFGRGSQSLANVGRFVGAWFVLSILLAIWRSVLLTTFGDVAAVTNVVFSLPAILLSALVVPTIAYYLACLGGYDRLRHSLPVAPS
ncbi:hypothetical protein AUR64_18770 [Haloprofundus marisrubri]|uniref:Uncharacterized protein n=1 Tax=Haloprofundus marisrubri TaxID=1514971 RepID=A0A0W1R5U8_9EURY|nr:hypothetical protein [Haloprofundus marisrubri]KTG08708.1 hypothetical protein AUR64_18770 [Haloprofundus marisrubri]